MTNTVKIKQKFKKNSYEKTAWQMGTLVCGVDEVGRSCLAGPVVAAAVILKAGVKHPLLKDSKLLSAEQRLRVYNWLQKNMHGFAVAFVHPRTIDKINIYQATLVAMKRAVTQLLASTRIQPSSILVDAMPLQLTHKSILPVVAFCKGESLSSSIAAASIIAKVTRDDLMMRLDRVLPGYNFITNKGYGTQVHKAALDHYNHSILHRVRFLRAHTYFDSYSGNSSSSH